MTKRMPRAVSVLHIQYSKHLKLHQISIVEANLKMHLMHINSGRHNRSITNFPSAFDHDFSQLQVTARPN